MLKIGDLPGVGALLGRLLWGHISTPRRRLTVQQRLSEVPLTDAPLRAPITIRWDEHMIPFIEAESEADLAVGLGIVHAHLRLAQMEFMRVASQGRLSEWLGPLARGADHTLRVLNLGACTDDNLAALPESARQWMDGFAAGINHVVDGVQGQRRQWPEEMQILGVSPSHFSVSDLLTLCRLNSADFTWGLWPKLLPMRERSDWKALWRQLMRYSGGPPVPIDGLVSEPGGDSLAWLSGLFGKPGGSNAVAVDARRGAGGTAKLSGDPHLPMVLPGFWLLAGLRCPGFNAVGYMLPGVPAVMVGRSPHIAWGGTSLHAASSDLFDVSAVPESSLSVRRETLKTRWGKPVSVTVRDSEWGPVLSDAPLFGGGKAGTESRPRFAMKWMGHQASDEISALLAAARTRNFSDFQRALSDFGVAGQNMVYADVDGNIGQLIAAKLPRRPARRPADVVLPATDLSYWQQSVNTLGLPCEMNPPEGFVASANNRPRQEAEVYISGFFSPDDRVERLRKRLAEEGPVDHALLKALQCDIHSDTALALRDKLLPLIPDARSRGYRCLADWDGDYSVDSEGALLFESLLYHFALALRGGDNIEVYTANWDPRSLIVADVMSLPDEALRKAMRKALPPARRMLDRYRRWGAVHRLRANHPLAALPVLGRRWRFAEMPVAGANETLMKSAHGFAVGKHYVGMSSTARYLFDLGDEDGSWFVMLGGQDGHPGSAAFFDQQAAWHSNTPIQLPLSDERVKAHFSLSWTLHPPESH